MEKKTNPCLVPCLDQDLGQLPSESQIVFLSGNPSQKATFWLVPNGSIGHEQVQQVVCRQNVAFIVTEPGHVYSVDFGCTYNRPLLGIGESEATRKSSAHQVNPCFNVFRIDFSKFSPRPRIVQVSAGYTCVFFLCQTGRLFYAGANLRSCMGMADTTLLAKRPRQYDTSVFNHEKIVTISCAAYSTCFVTEDKITGFHNLYYAGGNQYGECSTGDGQNLETMRCEERPRKLDSRYFSGHHVKKIVAGDHSFQILTQTGRLFGNGYNSSGQLFLEGTEDVNMLTEAHPSQYSIVDCACQFYSSVVLDSSGDLINSGPSQSKKKEEMTIEGVEKHDIRSIEAGDHSLAVITHQNKIYWMVQPHFETIVEKRVLPLPWSAQCMMGREVRTSCDSVTAFYLYSPLVTVARHFPRLNMLRVQGILTDTEFIHSS